MQGTVLAFDFGLKHIGVATGQTVTRFKTIERFAKILNDAFIPAPIRATRGQDIMAACGQLKSASERKKKSEREFETRAAGLAD